MLDNQLIAIFIPLINTGLINLGYTGINITAGNQPVQQGANTAPTIYFYKITDHAYGFMKNNDEYDPMSDTIIKTQQQWYEADFQVNAWVTIDPSNVSAYTASDLVNATAFILNDDNTVTQLNQNNIGIYRISDMRNPYITNEYSRYQASPSFDFTLTHKMVSTSVVPVIESTESGIYGI